MYININNKIKYSYSVSLYTVDKPSDITLNKTSADDFILTYPRCVGRTI